MAKSGDRFTNSSARAHRSILYSRASLSCPAEWAWEWCAEQSGTPNEECGLSLIPEFAALLRCANSIGVLVQPGMAQLCPRTNLSCLGQLRLGARTMPLRTRSRFGGSFIAAPPQWSYGFPSPGVNPTALPGQPDRSKRNPKRQQRCRFRDQARHNFSGADHSGDRSIGPRQVVEQR